MKTNQKEALIVCAMLVVVILAIGLLTGCATLFADSEATYYNSGTTTADGSKFDPSLFTCAVKNRAELHTWIRFEYHGNVVYCWANDVMPKTAKADYDLTPAAFQKLAPLTKGRIKVNAEEAP